MIFVQPHPFPSSFVHPESAAGLYDGTAFLLNAIDNTNRAIKRKCEQLDDGLNATPKRTCLVKSVSDDQKSVTEKETGGLPRGWLQPEWLYKYSRVKNSKGEEVITTDVLDSPELFLWLRENKYPNLSVSQYRTSVRRLIDDMGPGYNNNKLDEDVTKVLRKRIAEYGKKYWGFQKVLKLRKILTKPRRGSSKSLPDVENVAIKVDNSVKGGNNSNFTERALASYEANLRTCVSDTDCRLEKGFGYYPVNQEQYYLRVGDYTHPYMREVGFSYGPSTPYVPSYGNIFPSPNYPTPAYF